MTNRQKRIRQRRIFLISSFLILALAISVVAFAVIKIGGKLKGEENTASQSNTQTINSSESPSSSKEANAVSNDAPKVVQIGDFTLDAEYENLLLVNADNPLPDSYDSDVRKDLVTIDEQYRNNNYVTDIHKDVYPYITAMVATAQKEGVNLRVWSPFRSYSIQNDLFLKQVERMKAQGYSGKEAEDKAATVVARPGTSEHNTGLCADFNMADDKFENTKEYEWMVNNAEKFGFVMRYSAEKKPITGVIHESWHWRFVGINAAKEMNKLGYCLEEYVEYRNNKK